MLELDIFLRVVLLLLALPRHILPDACLFSFIRITACRNFHITCESDLDVAHDFSFEAIQPAFCPEKDLGNLVDVSSVRRNQLA